MNKDKSAWKPCSNDRVCSKHFVDGVPTVAHPDPSLHMGYDLPQKKSKRELFRQPMPPKSKPKIVDRACEQQPELMDFDIDNSSDCSFLSPSSSFQQAPSCSVLLDHSYLSSTPHSSTTCAKCDHKSSLINSLVNKINKLTIQSQKSKKGKYPQHQFSI